MKTVCYIRLLDAGTDNACWVVCAKGDRGAMEVRAHCGELVMTVPSIDQVARAFYEGCSEQTKIERPDLNDQPSWDSGGAEAIQGRRVFIAGAKRAMELLGRKE